MTKSNFALRLLPALLAGSRRLAGPEGDMLNQLINVAAAEKLSALPTEKHIAERATCADIPTALEILKRAGADRTPMCGDELPAPKRR